MWQFQLRGKIEFPLHQSSCRAKPRRSICSENSKKSPGCQRKMILEKQPHSSMVCQECLNGPLWQNQSQNLGCVFQQLFSHSFQPVPLTVNMSFWSWFSWGLTCSRKPLLKKDQTLWQQSCELPCAFDRHGYNDRHSAQRYYSRWVFFLKLANNFMSSEIISSLSFRSIKDISICVRFFQQGAQRPTICLQFSWKSSYQTCTKPRVWSQKWINWAWIEWAHL